MSYRLKYVGYYSLYLGEDCQYEKYAMQLSLWLLQALPNFSDTQHEADGNCLQDLYITCVCVLPDRRGTGSLAAYSGRALGFSKQYAL